MSHDLLGKRIVITGANTGIGYATALELARRGAHIIAACRSETRASALLGVLGDQATFVHLDLSSLASTESAANTVLRGPRIDALIHNAAVAGTRGCTEDGFEMAFGVNHLAPLLLSGRLLHHFTAEGRLVHLSSGSHRRVRDIDWTSLTRATRSVTGIREYAVSKLCALLAHQRFARARRAAAPFPISIAVDPGDCASEAWRHVPWPVRAWITAGMNAPSVACLGPVRAASGAVENGAFLEQEALASPSPTVLDKDLEAAVWERSWAWLGGSVPATGAT